MNIKRRISFDEFNSVIKRVIDDCFIEGTYSPSFYDMSLRNALISVYAPEFELNAKDNNTLYDCVYTEKACEIIDEIKERKQYLDIIQAINNGINFRKNMITSGGMSMSDLALANLIDKITEVVGKLGDNIDAESTKKFVETINTTQGNLTAENMVKALVNANMIGDKK